MTRFLISLLEGVGECLRDAATTRHSLPSRDRRPPIVSVNPDLRLLLDKENR